MASMSKLMRCLCFLACIPSGGALLLKVWGLATMAQGGALFVLCLPILLFGYFWALRHDESLARALRLGSWAGLLGTIGYDLVRVPFHVYGFRVFAPIQAYGVWLLEGDRSSGWSEAMGWLYHFSNGITFGIMYALVMGGRHWGWGVLWGLCLESIVLSSPFARIFHIQGNWPAIAIAYGAHVAYGYPLGYLVGRWEVADLQFREAANHFKLLGALLLAGFIAGPIPTERARDQRALAGTLRVEGLTLNPSWVRLAVVGSVQFLNEGSDSVVVVQPSGKRELVLEPNELRDWKFERPGIYQFYLKSQKGSKSSFVIVEPVEQP